jgi:hypothetical protein
MMLKSTWLMAILGLFLAATLIWAFPVFAELQSGSFQKSNKQGLGTSGGNGFGSGGTIKKTQESSGDKFDWRTPGQGGKQAGSKKIIHTPEAPDHQPRSQTPGGTNIQ